MAFSQLLEFTKFVIYRGSAPDPAEGAYSAPPDPLASLRGPNSKGKGVRRGEGRKREETILHSFSIFRSEELHEEPVNDKIERLQI